MKGSGLVVLSAFFFATYGIWSKLMAGTFGEFNQATVKAVILLTLLIPVGVKLRWYKQIAKRDWKWFVVISLAGGLNQAPYFFGFEHLSVGTATLLFYTSLTLGVYGIGIVFFGEKLSRDKLLAFGLSIAGLGVIYKLQLTPGQILPALATVTAGLMGAVAVALSKKLSGNYSEIQIICGYLAAMIVVNPIFSWIAGEPMPAIALSTAWAAQIGYAASYLIANVSVVAGFRHLEPSIGALIGLLEVLFAAVYGIVLFSEALSWQLVTGGGLILAAIAIPDAAKIWAGKKS